MAADETHAHRLAGEHAVLCKGGLFLRGVEALRVLEETINVMVLHCLAGDYLGISVVSIKPANLMSLWNLRRIFATVGCPKGLACVYHMIWATPNIIRYCNHTL